MSNASCALNWFKKILRNEQPICPDSKDIVIEEQIWETGLEHGVLPLCFFKLTETNNWETISKNFRERLKIHTMQSAAVELIRNQELKQIVDTLYLNNLRPLLIKGAPLSYSIYPKPYLRPRYDTDLLFPDKATAESAWRCLQARGYERSNAISGDFISHEFSCLKTGLGNIKHNLDLHWRLSNNQIFSRFFNFDELIKNSLKVPGLHHAQTLCLEHSLLLACIHRISHKPEGSENKLIWLYDIHLICLTFTQTQWNNFMSLATDKKLCGICLEGLHQSIKSLGTPIPKPIMKRLNEKMKFETLTAEIGKSRIHLKLINFRALPTWKQRFQFLKEHLFPDARYMLLKYETKNRFKLPVLYLIRIAQGIPKFFK